MGRYGGEEFALVLEDLELDDAQRLVDRLRLEFAEIEHAGAEPFRVTFSAGLAPLRAGQDHVSWFRAADQALYAAKRAGRNRVALA
jgi:diguanylate cyclase (GGDEF)-like protein